jgi:hypothetical protein
MTWDAESFEVKIYCSFRWEDRWDQDKWSRFSIDDQSMRDVCLDQDTWDNVSTFETRRIDRLLAESRRLRSHFDEWEIQWELLNQAFRRFLYQNEFRLHSFSTKRRTFDDSRIFENDSDQIRSNRSIYTNERWAYFEIRISRFHENAKDRHEAIRLVYVISEW